MRMNLFESVNPTTFCHYVIRNHSNSIIYCKNQTEGKDITKKLNEVSEGCAGYIDCNTKKKDRQVMIERYKRGNLSFLVNVNVLTEGFDAPITQSTILYHIPKSRTKLL